MDASTISITLKRTKGGDLTVVIAPSSSVEDLKKEIQKSHSIDPASMRLVFRGRSHAGRILKDPDVLSELGVTTGSVVHLVVNSAQAPPPPAAPTVPMQTGSGEMAGLLGALNSFGAMQQVRSAMNSLPDPSSLSSDLGGIDPTYLQTMMQNPQMRQMMEQMLQNDQFIDYAISSNPALQGYMQQHPEMAQALRDPMVRNMMRQQMQRMFSGSATGAMSGTPGSFPAPGNVSPAPQPPAQSPAAGANPAANPFFSLLFGNQAAGQPAAPGGNFANPFFNPFMNPFLFGNPAAQTSPQAAQPSPPQAPFPNPMLNPFASAFFAPQAPAGDPRELYRAQLQQMRDMGFVNEAANLNALQATGGNVEMAVEYLLRLIG